MLEYRLDENPQVDLSFFTGNTKTQKIISHLTNFSFPREKNFSLGAYLEGLELDIVQQPFSISPGIFLKFSPSDSQAENWENFSELIQDQALITISPNSLAKIRVCYQKLPLHAYCRYFGYMLSRGQDRYKLVMHLPKASILAYLKEIAWPGDFSTVSKFLSEIAEFSGELALNVDISEGKLGKLGFEIYPPPQGISWKILFTKLLNQGLCLPQKMQDLLAAEFMLWHPDFHFYLAHLNHLKVSFAPEGLSAKAYVYYVSSALPDEPSPYPL